MKIAMLFALAAAFNATVFISGIHAAELQKVRIGYPSSAVSTLPFDIAKEKAFYVKAGLDVEYIQMRSALGPQAILNGNIHFFTSPQSAINAAVAGLPLVVVLSLYRDSPWVLVTNKEIGKAHDLLGKRIAISDIRSSPYYFARAGLRKLAIEEKQVSLVTTGGTSNSFATLTTNQVAGAVLSPPFDEKAVSLGYKKFLFLGDLADIPYVGLFTSQAEIRNNRERIRRTIAAVMEAAAWQRNNRAETIKMIANRFKISPSEAERSYDTMTAIFSPDGAMNIKKIRGYLNLLREERPVPEDFDAEKLVDFSMLPAAR
ncbi:MAG TPA: ABC transporter substrate-binding protein [Candidatus Limnocylindrales bacterium]|nr:ABC transporter substrate-binding protein [Candidatus Limnocylindrales bacterium]